MRRRSAWLSRGFEELVSTVAAKKDPWSCDFDVVVVGSGYGGAIAAAELAGCSSGPPPGSKISVCVLERGKEYLPGMFPARLADLAGHVRFSTEGSFAPRGRREGLFDMRVGPDVAALLANGLGGGSLINAGVMEEPLGEAFAGWPQGLEPALRQGGYFARAKTMLGAADEAGDNGIGRNARRGSVAKHAALRRLAGAPDVFREAAVTIAMQDKSNIAGVERKACQLCGDCATGCNYEAKDSLDTNLLVKARRRGATIYCGATVLRLAQEERTGLSLLEVVYTEATLRKRQGPPLVLRARKVILAAGTYGSTEILLRSRSERLAFSQRLGQRFSANGDSIAVLYGEAEPVRAAADERVPPAQRDVGPTITGVVDLRRQEGCLVEDLGIPAALRRAFEEVVTTSNTLHELGEADKSTHDGNDPRHDPCAVHAQTLARSSVLALMGHDGAEGAFELLGDGSSGEGDGAVRVHWPALRNAEVFARQHAVLERLARNGGPKARVLPNPLWKFLPGSMQFLLDNQRGPAFTVHPLGGCSIGSNVGDGVVNQFGQVFKGSARPESTDVWPGLVVLDGSIVRSSLGTNPALTIAALALRAVETLRAAWSLRAPPPRRARPVRRPMFSAPPDTAEAPAPTEVELMERMAGSVQLGGKTDGRYRVELTLCFQPKSLESLFLPRKGEDVPLRRSLEVKEGTLRIFDEKAWSELQRADAKDGEYEAIVLLRAPLSGKLELLHREASTWKERRCRGFRAYALNRGLRDTWQWVADAIRRGSLGGRGAGILEVARERLSGALKLATRAGEVRLIEYELAIDGSKVWAAPAGPLDPARYAGKRIKGRKRLTYGRCSNPWRQLMQMTLEQFPCMDKGEPALLELDAKFLASQGVPLLHVVGQQDQTATLADLASMAGYFTRLLLTIHVWSFRRPDAARPREPQRLPGVVRGLPHPGIRTLEVDRMPDGTPVNVRLTRYLPRHAAKAPVVLVHGYSASGTTFAHPAVKPNLAGHLCERKRDVWILDLRTSSGMPTARHPWAFEDAALADLPAAIDFICRETGSPQVDVFAHCMGSAMLSMAVLAPPQPGERFFGERDALPRRIRRAVLSQIGPHVVMSPANIFRGYAMSYLRHFLPLARYDFRVPEDPGLAGQLMDRLLATLPYPEAEFRIENPWQPWKRTPFVGTRHRMDALYGRDFSLADKNRRQLLSNDVLEHIDDLFGPLSIETVAQAIHFARDQMITDGAGKGYPRRERFRQRWTFPTLSLHGKENGLADFATLGRMERLARDDGHVKLETHLFEGFGHQDSLIGKDAGGVFEKVSAFLD